MMNTPVCSRTTITLYQSVIDEVVKSVREYFIDEGIDDVVLNELKEVWEQRLNSTGVLDYASNPRLPSKSSNVPAAVFTADVQAQSFVQTCGHSKKSDSDLDSTLSNFIVTPQASALAPNVNVQHVHSRLPLNLAGSSQHMAMESKTTSKTSCEIKQNLSAGPVKRRVDNSGEESETRKKFRDATSDDIPQFDGPGDPEDDFDADELIDDNADENEAALADDDEEAYAVGLVEEGEPLNSEDDDLINECVDDLFEADDFIVCQYEKVEKQRNRWKLNLKDGVMKICGRDYVFNKAVGESDF